MIFFKLDKKLFSVTIIASLLFIQIQSRNGHVKVMNLFFPLRGRNSIIVSQWCHWKQRAATICFMTKVIFLLYVKRQGFKIELASQADPLSWHFISPLNNRETILITLKIILVFHCIYSCMNVFMSLLYLL